MNNLQTPQLRIVSLVPSLTHTLCFFGLQSSVVGCTSFCTHPANLRHNAVAVGGTKDPQLEKIISLKPTHILINHEENVQIFVKELRALSSTHGWQVVETSPVTVLESLAMVQDLGSVFGFELQAKEWAQQATTELELCSQMAALQQLRYCYFIWREPWMVVGNQTYIAEMLKLVGLVNVIETSMNPKERYPAIAPNDPRLQNADVLLFSSEPYAFKNRHLEEFLSVSSLKVAAQKIDGQMLSWFGAYTLEGLQYLRALRVSL